MKWNDDANTILKRMYPTSDQRDIITALYNIGTRANWKAVQIQAYYLGLVRYGFGGKLGQPKYGLDKVYCPNCNQFRFKEKIVDEKCDVCGTKVRDPSPNNPIRRKPKHVAHERRPRV